ncbi:MAG TPA: IclR family transcriptional regulator [Dehalococcoidia bacterium]|nr:IclR family transcriptional regulator [Dehalococcoidia bacterium]
MLLKYELMKEKKTTQRATVRSVQRAARIITALAEHPYPMGVAELASRVMLSPGSVHRMLSTLIEIGWVDQNTRTGKYRLGTRMLGIGSTGLITSPVVQNGRMFLARLSEMTGYASALSTLVGLRVIHLARAPGNFNPTPGFEPGVSQPAHTMADGKLLLAYLPPAERAYLYEVDGLRAYTPRTITDPELLEKELACIRERGYATDNFERFEATRGVAVPVFGLNGEPLLAMLAIGPLENTPEHDIKLATEMKALATEMSDYIAEMGDMPRPSTEFAKYNLQ